MHAAVLGSPVGHSLSPVLHTAAYRALGLDDWVYTAHECTEDQLAAFVDGLDERWAGLSLTMPLKRVALEVATDASPLAAAVGAANTLVFDGRRYADNTDVHGIVGALGAVSGRAVVLGAGGTAQAALAALQQLGIEQVDVLVRDLSRTTELRATAERLGVAPEIHAALADPARFVDGADVVISTLPAGAADHIGCRGAGTVLDVVYAPWPTKFAQQATGARVVSGLEMLLHQAVEQVRLMTGKPGPVEAMRAALDAAVAARR
ncbi:shikimate dehydrogenase [Pseudonocardia thermophila]|uniref:Shikimate dehydrogenase n=1 Tax=Pseudonocardia thermophila TaxID=1848 RepID=A0A1M6ZKH3_PSETH|nr:shikimate dehydrogenase [Pseudonocardia thermophila]SHL30957.1 shikimate dehydrogenase [Pseudonocardia thermophila]